MRTLCHCSSFEFNAQAGDSTVLRPGTQNAQGVGVYFSEGTPDERASDSCYESGGAKTIFVLESDASTKNGWWRSKPSMDKKKKRPPTWHSSGSSVLVKVSRTDGVYVYGTCTRL